MIRVVFGNKPASSPHADIIDYFLHHQHKYEIRPDILDDSKQRHINWKMRALLLDWMIEVTSEFKLHRETFYLALNYLDRYIGKVYHIEKRNYQLIGTAALYLACKVEEIYTPRISYFILATDHGYAQGQILEMERKLCMELEWDLTPASLETWTRLCCFKWDEFCESSEYSNELSDLFTLKIFSTMKKNLATDKKKLTEDVRALYEIQNSPEYKVYRQLTQIIDTVILDIETLQYTPQALVLAAIFSVAVLNLNILTARELIRYGIETQASPVGSEGERLESQATEGQAMTQTQTQTQPAAQESATKVQSLDNFVKIYSEFLQRMFGIAYEELAPTFEYVCPYAGGIMLSPISTPQYLPGGLNIPSLNFTVSPSFLFKFILKFLKLVSPCCLKLITESLLDRHNCLF